MGKAIIILFLILVPTIVGAVNYEYKYNPYTGKLDRTSSANQTGQNYTFNNIIANEFSGGLNSSYVQNTPAPCPGSGSSQTYIKEYAGATTTCTGITNLNGSNILDIYLLTAGDTTPDGANFTFDDTDNVLFIDSTNNRVGIGTTDPGEILDVSKANSAGETNIRVSNPSSLVGTSAGLMMRTRQLLFTFVDAG